MGTMPCHRDPRRPCQVRLWSSTADLMTRTGLTADVDKTQQYAEMKVQAEFENHRHVGVSGPFGLTGK